MISSFYYLDPMATLYTVYRFVGQPKFAGKTYMKFESQESRQRIRQESKLPVSGSPADRDTQYSMAALTLCQQIVLWHASAWKFVSHIF